jgi:glutathione synthase/RimK-type ligase-like ATP-grasp enzyme
MRKRFTIGVIIDSNKLGDEERAFLRVAKRNNIEIVFFNANQEILEKELEQKAKRCDIIYNDTAEYIALELAKTLEELGKKVIDCTKIYYYQEDKWMFFLHCKRHKIPTPETILLSDNLEAAKQELEEFNHWPIILKRVYGERGEFVAKANNLQEAVSKILGFWKKGNERLPIIAQEFAPSDSYRVTVIDGRIMQTAIKRGKQWKKTGCHSMKFGRFKIDSKLKKIVDKTIKSSKIDVCGLDLLKKDGKWLLLEINAEPSFQFFDSQRDKLIQAVFQLLKKRSPK